MSTDNQTIRVSKTEKYAVLDKQFLDEDPRLSWKAKGLLAYLLAKPDNWEIRIMDLVKRSADGKDSVYAGLKELETCGYLQRKRVRQGGKFCGYESVIHERPVVEPLSPHREKPDTVKPDTGKPLPENPPLVINDLLITNISKEQQQTAVAVASKHEEASQKKKALPVKASPGVVASHDIAADTVAESQRQQLIEYAGAHGIELTDQYTGGYLSRAGGLSAAKAKIDAAAAFVASERNRGKKIENLTGILEHVLKHDLGTGAGLISEYQTEKERRIAENEKKYADLYLS